MKSPKILVVGSCAMDLIVSTARFPSSGESVFGCGFETAPGGKGANQAVQAARLGAQVTMVGKVGNDAFGDQLLRSAKAAGIDISHISRADSAPTAIANILLEVMDGQTANRIIVVPGANMCITQNDIAFLEDTITDYDMVMLQLEIPMEINEAIIRLAHRKGVPVMLNSAPYAPINPEVLSLLSFISPNEHEAADMTGISISDAVSAQKAAVTLRDLGVDNVIITLGGNGAAFADGKGFFISPCVKNVNVVDPTAAGDSFVAAFCTAYCAGLSTERAMKFANHTAALTVSRKGAQPSLPTLSEVVEAMKANGEDVSEM